MVCRLGTTRTVLVDESEMALVRFPINVWVQRLTLSSQLGTTSLSGDKAAHLTCCGHSATGSKRGACIVANLAAAAMVVGDEDEHHSQKFDDVHVRDTRGQNVRQGQSLA